MKLLRAANQAAAHLHGYSRFNLLDQLKQWVWWLVRAGLVFGICFIILYPIFTKVSIAFMHKDDIFDSSVVFLPRHFTLDNFKLAINQLVYPVAVLNTFWLSVGTSLLQLASCALAGYSFARLKFKGTGPLFAIALFTLVIPPQTIMVPTYLHFRFFDVFGIYGAFTGEKGVNLLESFWPFFISSTLAMGMKNGLYIFIFRQFFLGLPKELEEASFVDGAGIVKTFVRVMLPNAVPVIATVLLFSFVWQWNDSYFSNLFMPNSTLLASKLAAFPSAVRPEFVGGYAYSSMLVSTATLLAIAPIFVLYLFAQRFFVESVERSGVVG